MSKYIWRVIVLFFMLLYSFSIKAQTVAKISVDQLSNPSQWTDSVFKSLTPDQKIGQLIMLTVYSNADRYQVNRIADIIRYSNIGGLMFAQGGPQRQVNL